MTKRKPDLEKIKKNLFTAKKKKSKDTEDTIISQLFDFDQYYDDKHKKNRSSSSPKPKKSVSPKKK